MPANSSFSNIICIFTPMKTTLRNTAKIFLATLAFVIACAGVSQVAVTILSAAEVTTHAGMPLQGQHIATAAYDATPCTPVNNSFRAQHHLSMRTDAPQQHHFLKYDTAETSLRQYLRSHRNIFAPARPATNIIWPIFLHHLII